MIIIIVLIDLKSRYFWDDGDGKNGITANEKHNEIPKYI